VTLTVSGKATLRINASVENVVGAKLVIDNGIISFSSPVAFSFNELSIINSVILRSDVNTVGSDAGGFVCASAVCGNAVLNVTHIDMSSNGLIDLSLGVIRADRFSISSTATVSCRGRGYTLASVSSRSGWSGKYGLLLKVFSDEAHMSGSEIDDGTDKATAWKRRLDIIIIINYN
jgi:hypothetical protein